MCRNQTLQTELIAVCMSDLLCMELTSKVDLQIHLISGAGHTSYMNVDRESFKLSAFSGSCTQQPTTW